MEMIRFRIRRRRGFGRCLAFGNAKLKKSGEGKRFGRKIAGKWKIGGRAIASLQMLMPANYVDYFTKRLGALAFSVIFVSGISPLRTTNPFHSKCTRYPNTRKKEKLPRRSRPPSRQYRSTLGCISFPFFVFACSMLRPGRRWYLDLLKTGLLNLKFYVSCQIILFILIHQKIAV